MIIHLSAAGVPISWVVEALYKRSYGVAHASAANWYAKSIEDTERARRDSPQFLVELAGSDEAGWSVKRTDLWMDQSHTRRQQHDERPSMVQEHSAPLPLSAPLLAAINAAVHKALVDFGYLVPRSEWERRYPASVLIQRRFDEFNTAYDAWAKDHPDSDERMPFELKWVPFMESDGVHFPYSTGFITNDGRLVEHDPGEGSRAVVVYRATAADMWAEFHHDALIAFPDVEGARSTARLLNSGWSPEDVSILLRDQPVE